MSSVSREAGAYGEAERMKWHEFVLVLSGIAELTPAVANGLYGATGGDIELNMRGGRCLR